MFTTIWGTNIQDKFIWDVVSDIEEKTKKRYNVHLKHDNIFICQAHTDILISINALKKIEETDSTFIFNTLTTTIHIYKDTQFVSMFVHPFIGE